MPLCRRPRLGSPAPGPGASIRQKLLFSGSDGEDEPIEDINNSTGGESGFTEMDSPAPLGQRTPVLEEEEEGSSSPLNRSDEVELWDEESCGGSPALIRSPSFSTCSPSPRKSSRLFGGSPDRGYSHGDASGSSSPIPDCPDTPPHKTFRKLRLFDTPHTPKVSHISASMLRLTAGGFVGRNSALALVFRSMCCCINTVSCCTVRCWLHVCSTNLARKAAKVTLNFNL